MREITLAQKIIDVVEQFMEGNWDYQKVPMRGLHRGIPLYGGLSFSPK
jgi:hypothetical protein